MNQAEKAITDYLRINGYKVTPQRLAVYAILKEKKDHPTVETIHEILKKKYPAISMGTIYKTINLLRELGLVSEVIKDQKGLRYDLTTETHVNLICPKCGQIIDYKSSLIEQFKENMTIELNGEIIGQRLDFYKLCEECKRDKD